MKNGKSITEEQKLKEGSEMEEVRRVYFTREEMLKGLAHWNLGDWGHFFADYVVPEENKIYGYLQPKGIYWRCEEAYIIYALPKREENKVKDMFINPEHYYEVSASALAKRWDWEIWYVELVNKSKVKYYNHKSRNKNIQNKRKISFSDEERKNELMHWNLGEYGDFFGYYVVPEERKIYGLHVPRENSKFVHWASIHYIPYKCDEKLEKQFIEDPNATALDFIKGLRWFLWYVLIEDEQERERWEDGKENSENFTLV